MMKHLRGNWPAKILSVLAAIFMWFFIMKDQNPTIEVSYRVPLQVQNLNSQYILDGLPSDIRVTLSGPRNKILSVQHENLKAYVDASAVSPGQANLIVYFTPPNGMNVVALTPDSISISVDEYAEKRMNVEIFPMGRLSDTVAIQSVTTAPKEVTVTGRKQLLDKMARVVMKVDVTGQTKNFTSVGALEAWDANGNVLDLAINPAQAQAQYELNSVRTEKAVPVVVSTTGAVTPGYVVKAITSTPAQVTILGREELMDSITQAQTDLVNISGATANVEGSYNLLLPNGVTSTTKTVNVKVEIVKKE